MKNFTIIQTINLGQVDVPDDIDESTIFEYMDTHDAWPQGEEIIKNEAVSEGSQMSEKPIMIDQQLSEETCDSCDHVFEVAVTGNFQPVRCPDCGSYTMACNECDNHSECTKCTEIIRRINANQSHDVEWEDLSFIGKLKHNKDAGKLKIILTSGRLDPNEAVSKEYPAVTLYVDWLHATYHSTLSIGALGEDYADCTIENEGISFFNEYIAVKESGVTTYYGDFTVDINEERKEK